MSDVETRLSIVEARLAALEAAIKAPKAPTQPPIEPSTDKPKYDFEIKIGRDKGKKPSELSSKALCSLATFMDKCAASPQPGKEQYVESNRKAAGNYRRWAAYKLAVEQGIVTEPAAPKDPDWVTEDDGEADAFQSQYDEAF